MEIHPTVVAILQPGPKWWTDTMMSFLTTDYAGDVWSEYTAFDLSVSLNGRLQTEKMHHR